MADLDLSIGPPAAPQAGGPADELDDFDELGEPFGEDAPPVSESTVRGILAGLGAGASTLVGDPDVAGHWRFTHDELERLTPPLTSIINRRPAMRRAVAQGDYMLVAVTMVGYTGRNLGDLNRAKRARGEDVDGEAGFGLAPRVPDVGAPHPDPGRRDGDGVPAGVPGQ